MERKEFLSKLGIGLAAVCAGCSMVSCGSKPGDDPAPNDQNGGAPGNADITVNLATDLIGIGSSKVVNGIIVVRLLQTNTSDSFTAVQVACTHQGTAVNYNAAQGVFICPNHGSTFNADGGVVLGPATQPLKEYAVTVTGNTLTVRG